MPRARLERVSHRPYAEQLFDFHTISSPNWADAAAAVTPAVSDGVAWRDDALERMLSHTHGYPYFLQEFARHTWNIAPVLDISAEPPAEHLEDEPARRTALRVAHSALAGVLGDAG